MPIAVAVKNAPHKIKQNNIQVLPLHDDEQNNIQVDIYNLIFYLTQIKWRASPNSIANCCGSKQCSTWDWAK